MANLEEGLATLPDYMQAGMRRYMEQGVRPGNFLSAVLSNDLMGVFSRADDTNIRVMRDYIKFLYNYVPKACYGSPALFEAWIAKGGLEGKEEADDL